MSGEKYRPRQGERVRVVLEGSVTAAAESGRFHVGRQLAGSCIDLGQPHVVSVERLPDPEPKWQVGDIVESPGAGLWTRVPEGWRGTISGDIRDDDALWRPLTPLVRNGQPCREGDQ